MKTNEKDRPKGGQRLLGFISDACEMLRDEAGATATEVAALAGVNVRVVERFEDGENWPRDLETIVAAYAEIAGLDDTLQPWQIALDLWYAHGTLPMVSRRDDVRRDRTTGLQQRIAERISQSAQRTRGADRDGRSRKSTATKTRKAASG